MSKNLLCLSHLYVFYLIKKKFCNIFHLVAPENLIFLLSVETSSKSPSLPSRCSGTNPRYPMACPTQDVKVN